MAGLNASQGQTPEFISGLDQVTTQINQGTWEDQENSLNTKIHGLISQNREKLASATRDPGTQKALAISVLKLMNAIGRLGSKAGKVATAAASLSKIILGLPSNSKEEVGRTVDIFNALISQGEPGAKQSFANWIAYTRKSLSELGLSKEELLEIAPHLTYLNFDVNTFSQEEVHKIISECKSLEMLVLETGCLITTPTFPESLRSLSLVANQNLHKVPSLNKGLKDFNCSGNENLVVLPSELPNSLETFTCIDNPYVRVLPEFNEGLVSADCSVSRVVDCPNFPASLQRFNISGNDSIKAINVFPTDSELEELNTSKCKNLENIGLPLPGKLSTLKIGWCPNLDLTDDFYKNLPELDIVK